MIKFADESNIHALKRMWEACFGDSPAYIDGFFSQQFAPQNTLVYVEDGRPASMLFLLPACLQGGGERASAYYLYAACTLPEFRGRGYMGRLLNEAAQVGKKRGVFAIALMPAQESLFRYYEKYRFAPFFWRKNFILTRKELSLFSAGEMMTAPCAPEKIFHKRAGLFPCGLSWPLSHIAYAADEALRTGGKVLGNSEGYIFAKPMGDWVEIREMGFSPGEFGKGAGMILGAFSQRCFRFSLPAAWDAPSGRPCQLLCNGMLRWEGQGGLPGLNNAYLGLALD